MCPRRAKKNQDFIALRVFSNIDAVSLPQNVYYRVIAVREGGHAPETHPASSDMPPHHPACIRARCDAPVALLPPVPPSCLTLSRLTTRSTPLTLHGRALTNGPPHPVVLGQPIGSLWSNIRAKGTARSPPCRPHASVSPLQVPAAAPSVRGAHPGHVCRAFATATTLPDL